ncbi:hypothetical protein F4212_04915 [Candidatus Poribacteria bacterium]|nr:hypothetical protein [Candidatus Poribacteria bacterium]
MTTDKFTKTVLSVIAIALTVIAIDTVFKAAPALARSPEYSDWSGIPSSYSIPHPFGKEAVPCQWMIRVNGTDPSMIQGGLSLRGGEPFCVPMIVLQRARDI